MIKKKNIYKLLIVLGFVTLFAGIVASIELNAWKFLGYSVMLIIVYAATGAVLDDSEGSGEVQQQNAGEKKLNPNDFDKL